MKKYIPWMFILLISVLSLAIRIYNGINIISGKGTGEETIEIINGKEFGFENYEVITCKVDFRNSAYIKYHYKIKGELIDGDEQYITIRIYSFKNEERAKKYLHDTLQSTLKNLDNIYNRGNVVFLNYKLTDEKLKARIGISEDIWEADDAYNVELNLGIYLRYGNIIVDIDSDPYEFFSEPSEETVDALLKMVKYDFESLK